MPVELAGVFIQIYFASPMPSRRQLQAQAKLRTARNTVVGGEAAAHAACQGFAEAQAQTQCAGACGEEGFENVRHHVVRDAGAGILNAQLGGVRLDAAQGERQGSL